MRREKNRKIKVLPFKEFRHQVAYTAGLEYAKGEIVGMMDGDLQDRRTDPQMYRKITEEDYDIVSGKRTGRKGSAGRNMFSRLFHLIFRNIGDIRNIENYGNYALMKRIAVEALLSMKEKVRYLPGLRTYVGYKQGSVEYVRDDRFKGKPKMTIKRLFTLASDAIFSFSRLPIIFCLSLGIIGTLVFMMAGIYVIVAKIGGFAVPGWSSTLLSIYFLDQSRLVFSECWGIYFQEL